MRITFDTNVCNVIHDPDKWPQLVAPEDARKIRTAISDRRIAAFVSEATLFVECLSFPDKLTYLSVAGTPAPRPSPSSKAVARFGDLASIGMELLRAPLIGSEKFVDSIPWAKDEVYPAADRQTRFSNFTHPLPRHEPLVAYGRSLLASQPPVPPQRSVRGPSSLSVPIQQHWAVAIKREWESGPVAAKAVEKVVRPAVGEWCDALIVGSHVAYGNDTFCTADQGKNAGSGSLLHHTNRSNLAAQGIKILHPRDLVQQLSL